jgi:hypothetical protein
VTCCGCDCCIGAASDFCTCWVCRCTSEDNGFGDDDLPDDFDAEAFDVMHTPGGDIALPKGCAP